MMVEVYYKLRSSLIITAVKLQNKSLRKDEVSSERNVFSSPRQFFNFANKERKWIATYLCQFYLISGSTVKQGIV